jgi:ABC-type multidrug transport system ATPase subunit
MLSDRRIDFRGVGFAYLRGDPVFSGLDLVVDAGLTLVLGPNGSGKSPLLKLAAGVEKPDAGTVLVNETDLWTREAEARRDLAYVPEQPDITPYASVDSVMRLVSRLRGARFEEGDEALRDLGLAEMKNRSIRQLSKGQRHRVLLAAARVGTPRTLMLDEPLDGVDRGARRGVLAWIDRVLGEGGLAVVVTHDVEPFAAASARAVAMDRGRATIVAGLPNEAGARLRLLEELARGGS